MSKIAIVYHSGYGHTAVIAKAIAQGVEQSGAKPTLVQVSAEGKIPDSDWAILSEAHAIVFGAPTYMGSLSGPFKVFMDATSRIWMGHEWQNKLAAGFTNSLSLSGDKLNSLIQLAVFAAQHGMIWVSQAEANTTAGPEVASGAPDGVNRIGSYLGLMSQSDNAPADTTPPTGDIETAKRFGARIVAAAKRWG